MSIRVPFWLAVARHATEFDRGQHILNTNLPTEVFDKRLELIGALEVLCIHGFEDEAKAIYEKRFDKEF